MKPYVSPDRILVPSPEPPVADSSPRSRGSRSGRTPAASATTSVMPRPMLYVPASPFGVAASRSLKSPRVNETSNVPSLKVTGVLVTPFTWRIGGQPGATSMRERSELTATTSESELPSRRNTAA